MNEPGINFQEKFLAPPCTTANLDIFLVRNAILNALKNALPLFSGTLLDVGCGYMPYKNLVLAPPSQVKKYIGLDMQDNLYQKPDLEWDGRTIPLAENSIDCVLATEVFEHCREPQLAMREVLRVLRPGGFLFFTVPFLWPLHNVPYDEYRYTPFSLEWHLKTSGFEHIELQALGGWDASLAQIIGLWVKRRPLSPRRRAILLRLALPIVRFLEKLDRPPPNFYESLMITGLSGTAIKPNQHD